MDKLISNINTLIVESDRLLDEVDDLTNHIAEYKRNCKTLLLELKNKKYNEMVNDIAERALNLDVRKTNSFILKMVNKLLVYRGVSEYETPFHINSSDTDYNKRYVYRTKESLIGLKYNLEIELKK